MEENHWTIKNETDYAAACMDKAEALLDSGNKRDAVTELSLAEFHLKLAERMRNGPNDGLVLDLRRERLAKLTRRLGLLWRIIKRIM